ncbi:MAG: LuxR C-terminal-related transcriptional regulator [Coriobacteriales bacterium]|jgi:DNA-binding CsgD family transcriptional regulator|nr:LuxR C-terminal-related transcriptional regulator [Coriobacteriales bacterium]
MRRANKIESTRGQLGRLLPFALLVASYCILTNEAFPTLRSADDSIVVFRSLGMMAGFLVPGFLPLLAARLLSKAWFWRALFSAMVLGALLSFLAVMLNPAFLYSATLAFIVGIVSALVVCFWVRAFDGVATKTLLLSMPYISMLSLAGMVALLLLPQPYHELAVFATALCSIVVAAVIRRRHELIEVEAHKEGEGAARETREMSGSLLLRILAVTLCMGASLGVIRLLSSENLYETPDTLYLTFCVLALATLLAAIFFTLYRFEHKGVLLHLIVVVVGIIALSIFASRFTWIGHRGIFVFMGIISLFLGSFLFPIRFARYRSLPVMQVLSAAQFGIAAGTLLSYPVKAIPPQVGISLEIQIAAFSVSSVLLCAMIMVCIFGLRESRAEAVAASRAPGPSSNISPSSSPIPSSNISPRSPHQAYREHLGAQGLTARQAEIASLAAKGCSTPAIATELTISKKTVENHLARAYKALGVDGRQELVGHYRLFESAESKSTGSQKAHAGSGVGKSAGGSAGTGADR